MRQGGMKPKSHSSGVYWVRATGTNKRGSKNKETDIDPDDFHPLDTDHDGIVTFWEMAEFILTWVSVIVIFGWLIIYEIAAS